MSAPNIDDPTKCGLGEGEKCCAFLSGTPARWVCGRTEPAVFSAVIVRLAEGTMNAKYDPGWTPFPQCQEDRPR